MDKYLTPSKQPKLNPEEEKQCKECGGDKRGQCLLCHKNTLGEQEIELQKEPGTNLSEQIQNMNIGNDSSSAELQLESNEESMEDQSQ